MSSMIKNCPHNDYPSLCSRCSIERHAGSHRKLLNDIEQARVESAEQRVVEGLRAKGLLDDEPPAPRAGERDVAYLALAYLVCDGIVNSDKYYPPDVAAWARDLMVNEQRVGITLIREAIKRHNQHATLVAQRERLLNAVRKFVNYYDGSNAARLGNGQARRSLDEFRSLLATIEREGKEHNES